jgi:ribosomal protein S3AE
LIGSYLINKAFEIITRAMLEKKLDDLKSAVHDNILDELEEKIQEAKQDIYSYHDAEMKKVE